MMPRLDPEYCFQQHAHLVDEVAQQLANDVITLEELKSVGNEALLTTFNELKAEGKLRIGDKGGIMVNSRSSSRGYNYFSAYAHKNIHRAMESAVFEREYIITIPIRFVEFINKFKQEKNDLPTPEEMRKATQCSVQCAKRILNFMQPAVSMETVVDSDGSTLHDTIPDPNAEDPMGLLMSKDLKDFLKHFFNRELGPREAKALQMRYGIDFNQDYTLEDVGRQFEVTRERIRQIEAKALRKMRHPRRENKLRQRMEDK